jgi:hypothetical protein
MRKSLMALAKTGCGCRILAGGRIRGPGGGAGTAEGGAGTALLCARELSRLKARTMAIPAAISIFFFMFILTISLEVSCTVNLVKPKNSVILNLEL